MIRKKTDSTIERSILIGMIVNKAVLSSLVSLDTSLIKSSHFKLVAEWCISYFLENNNAPGKDIQSIFNVWSGKPEADPLMIDAIRDFLEHLSQEYEKESNINVQFLLDHANKYFSLQCLKRTSDQIVNDIAQGDSDKGIQTIFTFKPPSFGKGAGINHFHSDDSALERMFAIGSEPIIEFHGDAGLFLNKAFKRDCLIGVQAPEKTGKTWFCIDLIFKAIHAKRKVAFFQVGDLSEEQVTMRLYVRLSGMPGTQEDCGKIRWVKSLEKIESVYGEDEEKSIKVKAHYEIYDKPEPLSLQRAKLARKKFIKREGIGEETYLKTSIHPTKSIKVAEINGILNRWEIEEDFVPDVIIIDYADILDAEDNRLDIRNQIDQTWAALRRLSQEHHCLVVAPTQANAASYDTDVQTKANFSNDKRKNAHVTGMLGLNQNEKEKEMQVMRLNWILLRESNFNPLSCLHIGQCLTLGKFITCSVL